MSEENKKNRVRLKICGSQFVISADESEQYIQKIAKIVDQRVQELAEHDSKLSIQMATIVAALNYCDQYEKQRIANEALISKADECETLAREASQQLTALLTENAELKEEKAGLHKIIAELKAGTYVEDNSANEDINDKSPDFSEKENTTAEQVLNENYNKANSSVVEEKNSVSKSYVNKDRKTKDTFRNSFSYKNKAEKTPEKKTNVVKGIREFSGGFYNSDEYADIVSDDELISMLNEEV